MNRDDDPALAQYSHSVPHSRVSDAILLGEASLAGKLRRDLALRDPPLDIVRNLHIRVFRPKGIDRTSGHIGTLGCSLSCHNTD